MSTLLIFIDDSVEVEYGQFVLQEVPMARNVLTLPEQQGTWLATGGPGGLLLHSAGTDHYPAVRIELWNSAPLPESGDWDDIVDLACDLAHQVRLQTVTATPSQKTLTIPHPGPHHARVHSRQRTEAAELEEGTFAEGVERWLIQLWPA